MRRRQRVEGTGTERSGARRTAGPRADGPSGRRFAKGTGAAAAAVLAAALAATAAAAGPAAGQQGPADDVRAPETALAPQPFRLGPTVGSLSWEETGGTTVDDVTVWGVAVERLLTSFLAVRLDGGYGTGAVAGGGRRVDVHTYVAELALALRGPALRPGSVRVTPYAAAGMGTVVHDPEDGELTTASQNTLSYGLGVDVRPVDRFGARLEWRRHRVDLENLLDPTDRTGVRRDVDRLEASLYWAF